MPITTIDIGAAPDDGTGDPLRRAFQITNENFADLDTTKANETDVANALALKVDKVSGQTLMTSEERTKLAGIAAGATAIGARMLTATSVQDFLQQMCDIGPGYYRPQSVLSGLPHDSSGFFSNLGDTFTFIITSYHNGSSVFLSGNLSGLAAGNYNRTEAADVSAVNTAMALKADKTEVAQAIAMAQTFTAVPTTFQAWVIFVTLPHWRTFVWTGTKYERAPWHLPGKIFPADGPAAKVRGAIQLRSDVIYNTADYPDLAEFYGFTGPTFVLKDARARVIRGADLGKNTDPLLVNGYLQEDAIRNITGATRPAVDWGMLTGSGVATGAFRAGAGQPNYIGAGVAGAASKALEFDASLQVPTASENRVKSLVATHYVTI